MKWCTHLQQAHADRTGLRQVSWARAYCMTEISF